MSINTKISQEDCDNYYCGFERLMSKIIAKFENGDKEKLSAEFKSIIPHINTFLKAITDACKKENKPLKRFSLIVHDQIIKKIAEISAYYK